MLKYNCIAELVVCCASDFCPVVDIEAPIQSLFTPIYYVTVFGKIKI